MKKYKIWISIKEIDEDKDIYETLDEMEIAWFADKDQEMKFFYKAVDLAERAAE
jgi:hypothetical protein